jgi:excisionase family DNA binding protein
MSTVLLTPEQVAERLQVRPRTVREYLRNGKLRGTRLMKAWRVTEDALEEFIRHAQVGGPGALNPEQDALEHGAA